MATLGFPLRFDNETQKQKAMEIAKKYKRSLNAEILHMIDLKILAEKTKGTSKTKKV